MDTPGKRLRHIRKLNNFTMEEFAGILHKTTSTLSKYERDERDISMNSLPLLQYHFSVNPDWLLYGDSPMLLDYHGKGEGLTYAVPVVDITTTTLRDFLAGRGVIRYNNMPLALLGREVTDPQSLVMFNMPDDSLEPGISRGELVVADKSSVTKDNTIYLFAKEGRLKAGRLSFKGDQVTILSNNRPPRTVGQNKVLVIGEVACISRPADHPQSRSGA